MKKNLLGVPLLILIIVLIVLAVGTFSQNGEEDETKEGDLNLYYVSADGLSFYEVPYEFKKTDDAIQMVEEVLEELKKAPENEKCQSTIPQDILWSDVKLDGTNLIIDFSASYSKMNSTQEIFLRSGIVKTLVQIGEISTVEFKVGGMPLMATSDQPIGMMDADRFINDLDENWGVNQQTTMTLFYANETGDKLVERVTTLTVVNNIPMEQLIIEALMEDNSASGYVSPIPEGTKVIKTVTKDEICYVDLSKEFLNPMENVTPEISVYAIVNSLIEKDDVNQVQFTIEGQKITMSRETIEFETPFNRNLDLIESK